MCVQIPDVIYVELNQGTNVQDKSTWIRKPDYVSCPIMQVVLVGT